MSAKNKKEASNKEKQDTTLENEPIAGQDEGPNPGEEAPAVETEENTAPNEADALQKELGDLKDRLLRTMAEYDNFRKRTQKEKDSLYQDAVSQTIEAFIPLIDNFERALTTPSPDENLKKGFEMIYHQFGDILSKLGVDEIEALGQPFDPNLHNAVMHVEEDGKAPGEIVEILAKGYKKGDRVIRYAMVKVAN